MFCLFKQTVRNKQSRNSPYHQCVWCLHFERLIRRHSNFTACFLCDVCSIFIQKHIHSLKTLDSIFHPSSRIFYTIKFHFSHQYIIDRIIYVANQKCSKWSHNVLLPHETREMSVVVIAVMQKYYIWHKNRQPNLIAFFQDQRRLKSHFTSLITGGVWLLFPIRPDETPVQMKTNF